MVANEKQRIMITISKEQNEKIEATCKALGVTRSAFISMAVGEKLMSYDKAQLALNELSKQILGTSEIEGQLNVFDILKEQS